MSQQSSNLDKENIHQRSHPQAANMADYNSRTYLIHANSGEVLRKLDSKEGLFKDQHDGTGTANRLKQDQFSNSGLLTIVHNDSANESSFNINPQIGKDMSNKNLKMLGNLSAVQSKMKLVNVAGNSSRNNDSNVSPLPNANFNTVSGPQLPHIARAASPVPGSDAMQAQAQESYASFQYPQYASFSADMLSSEIKMIRLRISDYYRDPVMEPIFYKLWSLMLEVQYERSLLKAVSHYGHIPLAREVYERIVPVFEKALGIYFSSSYYVAKLPHYKAETVRFERFCYDFVSLFGVNILFLEAQQLEQIARKVYSAVTFNFGIVIIKGEDEPNSEGGLRLIDLSCVEAAFTDEDFEQQKKQFLIKSTQVTGDGKTTVQVYGRKASESEFGRRVRVVDKRAKSEFIQRHSADSDSEASSGRGSNDEAGMPQPPAGLFSSLMNPDEVKAEKERKRQEKRDMVMRMKKIKDSMKPLEVFTGVKDNPLPYEKQHLLQQRNAKMIKQAAKQQLPSISPPAARNKLSGRTASNFRSLQPTPVAKKPPAQVLGLHGSALNPKQKTLGLDMSKTAMGMFHSQDPGSKNARSAKNNTLNNKPLKPRMRSIHEMAVVDAKRFQTYVNYDRLYEFQKPEAEDVEPAPGKPQVPQKAQPPEGPSRLARARKHWPDKKKLKCFNKFELINLKTQKCRNKHNLSSIVNLDFDPKMVQRDPSELFEPRFKAYNAIKQHMNNIEMASTSWLNERSIMALENLRKDERPEVQEQVDHEVKALLDAQNKNKFIVIETKEENELSREASPGHA